LDWVLITKTSNKLEQELEIYNKHIAFYVVGVAHHRETKRAIL